MWMMAAMVAATVVSTAMSAKAASDKGIAEQNAANAQATGARRRAMEDEAAAKDIQVQVAQEEANRMAKLQSMIGTGAANAAASGIASDSASLVALQAANREEVGRGIMNISYNGQSRVAALRRQAQYGREAGETYERAGREARSAADTAMYGAIFKGASSIAMYGSMPGMGGGGAGADPSPGGLGKTASGNVFG